MTYWKQLTIFQPTGTRIVTLDYLAPGQHLFLSKVFDHIQWGSGMDTGQPTRARQWGIHLHILLPFAFCISGLFNGRKVSLTPVTARTRLQRSFVLLLSFDLCPKYYLLLFCSFSLKLVKILLVSCDLQETNTWFGNRKLVRQIQTNNGSKEKRIEQVLSVYCLKSCISTLVNCNPSLPG